MKKQFSYIFIGIALILSFVLCIKFSPTLASAQTLPATQNTDPVARALEARKAADNSIYQVNQSPSDSLYGNDYYGDTGSVDTAPSLSGSSYYGNGAQSGQSVNTPTQASTLPPNEERAATKSTGWSWEMLNPFNWIPAAAKIIGNLVLMMFGWALGLVGLLFNAVITYTIVDLKGTLDKLGVITEVWKVIRDFLNLFFIFSLLYAAIGTMLGLEGVNLKKTVLHLLIAALLMNFSLFFTKVIIDASNIVTIGFYSALPGVGAAGVGSNPKVGISNTIMQALKLETIYKPKYANLADTVNGEEVNDGIAVKTFTYILTTVMASIFICVTMVVMIAGIFLFVKRFINIIFLLIRSPIAFAGYILPQLEEYQKNWWNELYAEALFPPVYMAIMWIAFKIIQSPGFTFTPPDGPASTASTIGGAAVEAYSNLFSSLSMNTIQIVLRFVIVIAMMVYALKGAGKAGAQSTEMFTDYLSKKRDALKGAITGSLGRNTVGRAASSLQGSAAAKRLEAFSPTAGRMANNALKNVSGNAFGGAKGGFDQMKKDAEKNAKEGAERVSKRAEYGGLAPVRLPGEADDAFKTRETAYKKAKDEFEQKQREEAQKRQADYKANLAKGTPLAPDLSINTNGSANPLKWNATVQAYRVGQGFAENKAAVKAADGKIKEINKKDAKDLHTKEQMKEWKIEVGKAQDEYRKAMKERLVAEAADPAEKASIEAAFTAETTLLESKKDDEKAIELEKLFNAYKEKEMKLNNDIKNDKELRDIDKAEENANLARSENSKRRFWQEKKLLERIREKRNQLRKDAEAMQEKIDRKERELDRDSKDAEKKPADKGSDSKGDKDKK